ncbi:MAG: MotA/TolQ/ExbB proton channel family protein [bacterium]
MNGTLIHTFATSDFIGQIITLAIIGLSILAWFVILDKARYFRAAERNSQLFLHQYRRDREHIFQLHFSKEHAGLCPLYKIYATGIKEIKRHLSEGEPTDHPNHGLTEYQFEEIEEAVRRSMSAETASMEKLMIILAIAAVIGPLMGLLGTVWGIMNAFNAMATAGSPSLLIVAPGIAGALITTVVGLCVAIPSVAAYNIFLSRIRRIDGTMDDFASEFVSTIRRRLLVR